MEPFEAKMLRGGSAAIQEASRFFMRSDAVHLALRKVTKRLAELGISHAVAGGMALVAHGYDRTTVDVNVLVTAEGLETAHKKLSGLGYVPPFEGARQLRDVESGVRIEFLVTGGFPGDGKPKPVAFPDPAACGVEIDGVSYLRLRVLVELKLASGMTNPGRLRDLADVQELIRCLGLKADFARQIHPYVREKYQDLLAAVESDGQSSAPGSRGSGCGQCGALKNTSSFTAGTRAFLRSFVCSTAPVASSRSRPVALVLLEPRPLRFKVSATGMEEPPLFANS